MSAAAWGGIATMVTAVCGLLTAIVVEMIRSRRRKDRTAQRLDYEFSENNGKSARDAINRIEGTVSEIKETQGEQGERLARLEGAFSELHR